MHLVTTVIAETASAQCNLSKLVLRRGIKRPLRFKKNLLSSYLDTYRTLYPDKVEYSWWSYRFKAREKNAGWRIDYWLISPELKDKVVDAKILTDVYGSDHCPVELDIEL